MQQARSPVESDWADRALGAAATAAHDAVRGVAVVRVVRGRSLRP
ncbi:hypothetical protein ACQP0I_04530 [Micromonospora carbonacea]